MSDYLSFRLPEDFIKKQKRRKPQWGFDIGGGNSLAELTFITKYSRVKEDGTKERWWEVCRRCIEGYYSILKDHCAANRTSWNEYKAIRSAMDAYERMFAFKWLPPGRGLWMMGTEFVNGKQNSAALQNPLHEDTSVLTRDGWRRLGDLEGGVHELLTSTHLYGRDSGDGGTSRWVKAEVSMIEEQPSVEIEYRDTLGQIRTIVASENHRWFVRKAQHHNWKRVSGLELEAGDFLPVVKPRKNFIASHTGMQHGFFFGDGSRTNGEFEQFGSSVAVLSRLFGDQVQYRNRRGWVGQCPLAWGELPQGSYLDDQRYVYGFLAGYFAADGCVGKDGSCTIASARINELRSVRDLFLDLGIHVTDPKLVSTSSNFSEERELWQIRIDRFDLQEQFFLKAEHRERWLATTYGKSRTKSQARITKITPVGVKRVLCATVDEYEQFVTENFVLTSNCAFISTEKLSTHSAAEATLPFSRLMEMSMLGVGVGFDTRGAGKIRIHVPSGEPTSYIIPDTREGWCESVAKQLETYFFKNRRPIVFNYEAIRPSGEPIKGFGGIAAGPGPLQALHAKIDKIFADRDGTVLTSTDIADLCNLIAKCVVSGNVRRSALIALGDPNDEDYLNLKNPEINPERCGPDGWAWTSNNSVFAELEGDYRELADLIRINGEPGFFFLDLAQQYGRLVDPPNFKDARVRGCNPCAEQPLEPWEMCTLVETFPHHHDSLDDFKATLKHAYLYGKAVTLLPTHWPETNEVMQRNRRIGCSVSGLAQFVEARGWGELRTWLDGSYKTIAQRDVSYSEWLGVRESVKTTTVKPSGTTSLVAGATPGVHWPVAAGTYIRRMRLSNVDPILPVLADAGYRVEPCVANPTTTSVVELPTVGPATRTEMEVTLWEKAELAVLLQRWWSDNMVSCTLTFQDHEAEQLPALIAAKQGQLKTMSMLPIFDAGGAYEQMPYERIDVELAEELTRGVKPIDWGVIYDESGIDAEGERYCSNDTCAL